jgi:hypothetical protein
MSLANFRIGTSDQFYENDIFIYSGKPTSQVVFFIYVAIIMYTCILFKLRHTVINVGYI